MKLVIVIYIKTFFTFDKKQQYDLATLMKNKKTILNRIFGLLGILSLVAIIYYVYQALNTDTETNVISDDALKAIQDPDTADKLREAVDDYHHTREWDREKLESIL